MAPKTPYGFWAADPTEKLAHWVYLLGQPLSRNRVFQNFSGEPPPPPPPPLRKILLLRPLYHSAVIIINSWTLDMYLNINVDSRGLRSTRYLNMCIYLFQSSLYILLLASKNSLADLPSKCVKFTSALIFNCFLNLNFRALVKFRYEITVPSAFCSFLGKLQDTVIQWC